MRKEKCLNSNLTAYVVFAMCVCECEFMNAGVVVSMRIDCVHISSRTEWRQSSEGKNIFRIFWLLRSIAHMILRVCVFSTGCSFPKCSWTENLSNFVATLILVDFHSATRYIAVDTVATDVHWWIPSSLTMCILKQWTFMDGMRCRQP